MPERLDFDGLAARLLGQAETLLPQWLPGGKRIGHEYVCASLQGGPGKRGKGSCSINLNKGLWSDFSTQESGKDLIALYCAIRNLRPGDGFRELASGVGFVQASDFVPPPPALDPPAEVGAPPSEDLLDFGFVHPRYGKPSAHWIYRDEASAPLMVVARYETTEGKQIVPWTWHLREARWTARAWGYPSQNTLRPLYGLQKLVDAPGTQVLIVEGEKKADAAQRIVGDRLVVLGWPGGAQAIRKVDWTPLVGRAAALWPDADLKRLNADPDTPLKPYLEQPGPRAMQIIAEILAAQGNSVKILDVGLDETRADGWDAADAEAEGWDWDRFIEWAKPRLKIWPWAGPPAVPRDARLVAQEPAGAVEILPPEAAGPDEDGAPSPSMLVTWERLQLSCLKNGNPHINLDNVFRFLTYEKTLKDYLWFDEFHEKAFTQFDIQTFTRLDKAREWTDHDELLLLKYLQKHVGLSKMSLLTVSQGVALYAPCHIRNEPKEWLNSLVWDKSPRIEHLLSLGFGAVHDDYAAALSRNWLMSIAARILRPGCQVDTMPVLCGAQGIKKSTSLEALAAPWFAELSQKIDTLEFFRALRGKIMIEISELASFRKNQVEEIKKMLTTKQDHYRGMYGRHTEPHPRRVVFVGTTNAQQFLNDETGARRFWPIECKKCNPQWIRDNREQLFAEAVARVREYERTRAEYDGWWTMPVEATQKQQEKFRDFDEWEEVIRKWLHKSSATLDVVEYSLQDIAKGALGFDTASKFDSLSQMRVRKALRLMGWENKMVWREGHSLRVWKPKSDD